MFKTIILAGILSFAPFGLQACFFDSSPPEQHAQEQSNQTLCDANGNNCRPCDANTNCQSTATRSSWGFFF